MGHAAARARARPPVHVADVVAQARLATWSVAGPDLSRIASSLRASPGVSQVVAFGTTLHVSGGDPAALAAAIAPFRNGPNVWTEIPSGLEDVFIHLMRQVPDNAEQG